MIRMPDQLSQSGEVHAYDTAEEAQFELKLRKAIVEAAKELDRGNMAFRVFRKSKANPDFWKRTNEGGFLLQSGVKPSDAIRDIFLHSSQYGTECSTAMVIVYYRALLSVLPEELFNQLFSDIYLMNWQHLDSDLGLITIDNPTEYLPGDARYFKNPDVDPLTPEWQGENVFDMGGGQYYGHGIGITNANRIIDALNSARKRGATRSAFLMDMVERPNFKGLYKRYADYMGSRPATQAMSGFVPFIADE